MVIKIIWKNKGLKIGINSKNRKTIIRVDPFYFRPTEVRSLKGNFIKAKKILGWKPKTDLNELIKIMISSEKKKHLA